MTDDGPSYTVHESLASIEHYVHPHTPTTNGKAERFIQIILREWARAIPFKSSKARKAAPPRWLDPYITQRPQLRLSTEQRDQNPHIVY
ncbi:integrase core domain-containing protein [Pseudovibrio sp. Tun.PSC04-5.I4]|uniref:integrase core domain-containing protein n=1 Tax=Pseudovibrio sp. Tun.PSC04-5.I4 TaxID=1798213 RepID=UPI0013562AFB|nr:integrase core domain-containing protein [Pseudovibrio sp. Tun.PSC04-5.I4]